MNARYSEDLLAASPRRFAAITRAMNRLFDARVPEEAGAARVYLARKAGGHRRLVNAAEIEAIAAAHGFEIAFLEDRGFAYQLRLMRSAGWIAGPEGSAFCSAYFCAPGTRVCFLNHTHTEMLTAVTALFDAMGIATSVLTGPIRREAPGFPHFSDYEIDAAAFDRYLARWAA